MDCPYCSLNASDPTVVFKDDLVWFVQDLRYQGALKHSGIIIPVAHRETAFDLTEDEAAATFRRLLRVKAWMDAEFSPDDTTLVGTAGRLPDKKSFTPTCT